jgi:hypothetical protein
MPVPALALGVYSSAAVPRPLGSSFMPLRCTHQAPELRTAIVWCYTVDRLPLRKSWSAVYSAQRHQGGVGCPRQPWRTAAELSTPSASSNCKTPSETYERDYRERRIKAAGSTMFGCHRLQRSKPKQHLKPPLPPISRRFHAVKGQPYATACAVVVHEHLARLHALGYAQLACCQLPAAGQRQTLVKFGALMQQPVFDVHRL